MLYRILDTPTGPFAVCEQDAGDLRTGWVSGPGDPMLSGGRPDIDLQPSLATDLARYFAGDPVDFGAVPLPAAARDGFAGRCLAACLAIPRGSTRTYAELAVLAGGAPGAARAAGQAMRHNPLPIVVPCHRVRAAGGDIGGFAGHRAADSGPVAVKRWLLTMEGALDEAPRLPWPDEGGDAAGAPGRTLACE